jgi:sodium/potassium-transporting ATPase subunit alpha
MIRDMKPSVAKPKNAEDNLCIFLKGAPDRVHIRCENIVEGGKVIAMTENHKIAIENANTLFGNMGERVLGFSRLELDPKIYKKDDLFGTKDWKSWMTTKSYDANLRDTQGWFPMWGLTFVGLVSLNDPPRPGVDLAVQKCKAAGIKVIMVTGDQKNTAAAIAAKVSIITDKETEYNWLVDKVGLSKEKAME